jgi:hypothetical protein
MIGDRWDVQKGDLGVLKWVPHKRHLRFVEARVSGIEIQSRGFARSCCHQS